MSTAPSERRSHRRVATSLTVRCQRIGRSGVDHDVDVLDLSAAGVRIMAPAQLQVGDVVGLTSEAPDPLAVSGLVVHVSSAPGGARYGHIAFTHLVPETEKQIRRLVDLTVDT